MAIVQWGIIARSGSTGIQIRKKLTQAYDNHDDAAAAAIVWEEELNTEQKFGLTDWRARTDHIEGGPHAEDNPDPLKNPLPQQPNATTATGTGHSGMSGLPF